MLLYFCVLIFNIFFYIELNCNKCYENYIYVYIIIIMYGYLIKVNNFSCINGR